MQSQLPRWVIVVAPKIYLSSNYLHAFLHDISIVINFEIQLDQSKAYKLIVILNTDLIYYRITFYEFGY